MPSDFEKMSPQEQKAEINQRADRTIKLGICPFIRIGKAEVIVRALNHFRDNGKPSLSSRFVIWFCSLFEGFMGDPHGTH